VGGAFLAVAGEDDLGPAQDEGIGGTQRGFQLLFFGVRKGTDEERRFHGFHYTASHESCSGNALGKYLNGYRGPTYRPAGMSGTLFKAASRTMW
jgi:hypothetical protein